MSHRNPIGFEAITSSLLSKRINNDKDNDEYDVTNSPENNMRRMLPQNEEGMINHSQNVIDNIADQFESNLEAFNSIKVLTNVSRLKETLESIVKANRIHNFDDSQDFNEISKHYSLNRPFTDTKLFPRRDSSIYYTSKFRDMLASYGKCGYDRSEQITWKRAKDLVRDAQFAVDESGNKFDPSEVNEFNYRKYFHTTDLDQGCLGNCWFISAATGIIQNYSLFKRVVPFDNSFDDSRYTGAFHFRFWVYGTWRDVVVDDYLPVTDGQLIFSKNRDSPNEFWCALLEKAYAKLCGSYEALEGGFTSDALIDMSGGVEETYNLVNLRNKHQRQSNNNNNNNEVANLVSLDPNSLWDILQSAIRKLSVIGCNIEVNNESASYRKESKLPNGLVVGHAYIVTKLEDSVQLRGHSYRLLRLYNPWGNNVEWNGDWSDNSHLWEKIDPYKKRDLELKVENDGEFWMSFEDWLQNFDNCQICNLTPDTCEDLATIVPRRNDETTSRILSNIFSLWQCQYLHGEWIKQVSAGGRGEVNEAKYWTNPQFTFVLNEQDILQQNNKNNKIDYCWVIIALMQKYTRTKRIALKKDSADEYIQFRLYRARDQAHFLNSLSAGSLIVPSNLERISSSGSYINKREVTTRFSLKPGAYLIVPSCFDEDVEGQFLIRIFTEKPLNKKYLNQPSARPNIHNNYLPPRMDNNEDELAAITNDIQSLSTGASNVLKRFIFKASDFSKSTKHNEEEEEASSLQPYPSNNYPPSLNSIGSTHVRNSRGVENRRRMMPSRQISCNQM